MSEIILMLALTVRAYTNLATFVTFIVKCMLLTLRTTQIQSKRHNFANKKEQDRSQY